MKLLGKDISAGALAKAIEERLNARGLSEPERPIQLEGPEARVDPASFFLNGVEANCDPREWMPLHTHRAGAGRAVLLAKWAFRRVAGPLVSDALARQAVFNGHVRDGFLQMFTELQQLRRQVAELEAGQARAKSPAPRRRR